MAGKSMRRHRTSRPRQASMIRARRALNTPSRLDRLERWATVGSALTATAALLLTVAIWKDQQKFNRDQIAFNRGQQEASIAEQKRRELVYASRVSFWVEDQSPAYGDLRDVLKIENRSPAPLTGATVIFSQDAGRPLAYADPGVIPPCSLVTLGAPFFHDFEIDVEDRLNRSNKISAAFVDANQRVWQRNLKGELLPMTGNELGEDGPIRNSRQTINGPWLASGAVKIASTADCSEGVA